MHLLNSQQPTGGVGVKFTTVLLIAIATAALQLLLLPTTPRVHALSYRKVHLLDHATNPITGVTHYFFRTDIPCNNTNGNYSFMYDELLTYMGRRAAEANVSWNASAVYLTDLNTLNELKEEERGDISHEKNFFGNNSQNGTYVQWTIIGTLIDPNKLPLDLIKKTLDKWASADFDQLAKRIPTVRAAMEKALTAPAGSRPQVWFVHCKGGDDRTGEFSASYVMQYKNYTFKDALDWDRGIAGRKIGFMSSNNAAWYCWYLTYKLGFANLNCMSGY